MLKMNKIILVRIRGLVDVNVNVEKTLNLLRLRKKHSCVIVDETKETMGMIKKVQHYIAYGKINEETLKLLIMKRGRLPGDKPIVAGGKELDMIIKEFSEGKKTLKELGLKPFFRLHPPRKGFKKSIKLSYPQGVLGNNPKINEIVKEML
jgi:large subunit ribosomal protein L30